MPTPIGVQLDDLFGRDASSGVSLAFVAVRRGEVVAERYGVQPANVFQDARPIDRESLLPSWSVAKSITHAALGVLVGDGALDPSAPAPVPEWEGTDKAQITIDHLLAMRSGLEFNEDYVDDGASHCLEMLFSAEVESCGRYAADLPLVATPGEVFNYSSGTSNILARILGDVVTGRSGGDPDARREAVEAFLRSRVFEPAGMSSARPDFDRAGDFVGSTFVSATARDFARLGELYLAGGVGPDGHRVVSEEWTRHGTEWTAHDPESGFAYGRHWWRWPGIPGSYSANGYEGQFVLVLPDRDLVVVHLGKTEAAHHRGLTMRIARIVEAL